MKATEILKTAAGLVGGDRNDSHGDIEDVHSNIAILWNALLAIKGNTPLDAHDVATMMELLKIARRYGGGLNMDDYIDGAGYAALAGQIIAEGK